MNEEEVNKAIARVILSTKRKNRPYSLFEIANDVSYLKQAKGTLLEVAKLIGISTGMLSQFISVYKLPEQVIELVKKREIDSVSMVHHLSKFSNEDLTMLSELLASNKLSSQDLRILIPYRKQFKQDSINDLVDKIHSSKNIKVAIIRISESETTKDLKELNSIFKDKVGMENLLSIEPKNDFIDIKITKDGEKTLRSIAKQNKITLQNLITTLIN